MKTREHQMEELALKIIKLLDQHDMFFQVNIYVNKKCYSDHKRPSAIEHRIEYTKHKQTIQVSYYETPCPDVTKQVEYSNPDTLTMTFEGPLYHDMNYGNQKITNKLEALFSKYRLYSEQGYAWSLSLYEE